MANIKKNFNFRNGVQVDDDNLLVTSTGLVGIGTTIPVEALDVRGNVVITGFTSATTQKVGFLTVTTLEPEKVIGAGVSIVSGIVTAQGTGIVTFFGDARFLQGMPTSQWEDVDVGLGFTSIYNTGGNVGVGTEDPRSTVQVGGNVDAGERGVGISSAGNVNATGIITAASFVGDLTGNIVSASTFSGNIDLNADIDVDGHTNLDNVSVSGVTTTTGNVDINADLDVDGHTNLDNLSIVGVTTFAGEIDLNADLDVDGHTNLDNLSVAGVSTFASLIDINSGATINNVQIGVTGDNEIDTSSGNLTIDSAGGTVTVDDQLGVTGVSTFSNDIAVAGLTTTKDLLVTGISTLTGDVDAGFVKASSRVFATKLGVGTTESPVNDIQVRKSGDVEIQISSETGTAGISIGRETGNADTNNSEIRYGKVSAGAPYSSAQSLDILNYGEGNFNYHLGANNPGGVAGDFHWHKGLNSARLMTLTNTGRLGIGDTQPNETLTVSGVCTITSNSFVGANLSVSGNTTIGGNVTLGGILNITSGSLESNLTGNVTGNVRATSGISSFFKVGINTDIASSSLSLDATQCNAGFRNVGIGSTEPDSILDVSGALSQASKKFILLPKVSAAGTSVLQSDSVEGGALIYNTTLRKLQIYNGGNWETVTSVEVTG